MDTFLLGSIRVDLTSLAVHRPTETLSLTTTEAAFLRRLVQADGQPVDRPTLLRDVWSYAPTTRTRTVTTTLHRLRQKVEPDPSEPLHLRTHRGKGIALEGATAVRVLQPDARPLHGREGLLEQLLGQLVPGGVIALGGPIGAGQATLARALAQRWSGTALSVDARGCLTAGDVWALVVHQAPLPLPSTLEALCAWLEQVDRPLVVLSGLPPDVLEGAQLERLARSSPVLLSSPSRTGRETVVQVPPLDREDALALVRAEIGRSGHVVDEALVTRLVDASDRLPAQLVQLAPLVALFGEHALETLTLGETTQHAFQLLDPERRAMLVALSAFRGTFDLPAAEAVAGLGRMETLAGLQLLLQRGLLMLEGPGRFRVLRVVRLWAREQHRPVEVDERWLAFLVGLENEALVDGGRRTLGFLHDLVEAVEAAEEAHAVALAHALADVANLHAAPQARSALSRLAGRHPLERVKVLDIASRSFHGAPLTPADEAFLRAGTTLDAAYLGGRLGLVPSRTARELLTLSASEAERMRVLPRLLVELEEEHALAVAHDGARVAQREGWGFFLRLLEAVMVARAVFTGDFDQAVRRAPPAELPPDTASVELLTGFALGALAVGRFGEAEDALDRAEAALPGAGLRCSLYRAFARGMQGKDPMPHLELALGPLTSTSAREVALAARALWEGEPLPKVSERVVEAASGRLPAPEKANGLLVGLAIYAGALRP